MDHPAQWRALGLEPLADRVRRGGLAVLEREQHTELAACLELSLQRCREPITVGEDEPAARAGFGEVAGSVPGRPRGLLPPHPVEPRITFRQCGSSYPAADPDARKAKARQLGHRAAGVIEQAKAG